LTSLASSRLLALAARTSHAAQPIQFIGIIFDQEAVSSRLQCPIWVTGFPSKRLMTLSTYPP